MIQFRLSGCPGHDIKGPVISPYKHFEAIYLLPIRVQSVGLLHIISPLSCQAPFSSMKFKEYAHAHRHPWQTFITQSTPTIDSSN